MVKPLVHDRARGSHPAYPSRLWVPNDKVSWNVSYAYNPAEFTHTAVAAAAGKWADVDYDTMTDQMRQALSQRVSDSGRKSATLASIGAVDGIGKPRNPVGRTGLRGRGLLGCYGPNYAADPIVTRRKPEDPSILQMVTITRRDTGELAIPGGMVEKGLTVSATLRNEFKEEALRQKEGNPEMTENIQLELNNVFDTGGTLVYSGYVDDPRNTDEAWIESEVRHFHLSDSLGAKLPLNAGDDAAHVAWVDLTPTMNLYASHKSWIDIVRHRARTRHFGRV